MLVDQHYPNVLPLGREPLKSSLDRGVIRLGVYYEEVLLVVWRCGDMLPAVLVEGDGLTEGFGWERGDALRCQPGEDQSRSPVVDTTVSIHPNCNL